MTIAYYTIDCMNTLPRWRAYSHLLRLHQPIGIFLLLWPALWALWIANAGVIDVKILILFIIGALLTRSLGCVMNDIADRKLDGFVTRTRQRPLATGAVSLQEAVLLLILLSILAGLVVYQLNLLTIELAMVAVGMIAIYPFTKRYLAWPQLFLGLVFGAWSILMAFAAETGKISSVAWLLFLAAYVWCVAYDTIYAMVDREDDKRIGIKSSAIALGGYDVVFIAALQCGFVFLLGIIGSRLKVLPIYYVMLTLVVALFFYQHRLIKDRKPAACFQAFLNNAWIGGLIFLGFFFGIPH